MTGARLASWLPAFLMALALAVAPGARADTATDGPWRLTLEISSFSDGHIATIDRVIEIRDGAFNGGFNEGNASVALTFYVAGGAVRGNMAVDAGSRWNSVSIKYDGPVIDGVFLRQLVGPATYESGMHNRDNLSRNVDVVMRLERQ